MTYSKLSVQARTRPAALLLTTALALATLAFFSDRADALVYWSGYGGDAVGRADLNGKRKQAKFIKYEGPSGLAVTKTHIYWSDWGGKIRRSKLDGTKKKTIVNLPGTAMPGITVRPPYIYWSTALGNRIGRARLDGTSISPMFITGGSNIFAVTTNSTHILWSNTDTNTVGRALLDGSGTLQNYLPGGAPGVRALTASGPNLFWYESAPGEHWIGHAPMNGGGEINDHLISLSSNAEGLAAFKNRVYIAMYSISQIGRANFNGTGLRESFIKLPDFTHPASVAVDGIKTTKTAFKIRKVKVSRGLSGSVRLKLPAPGKVTITGPGLKTKSKKLKKLKGGKLKLAIAAKPGLLASTPPGATVQVKLKIKFKSLVTKKPRVKRKTITLVR